MGGAMIYRSGPIKHRKDRRTSDDVEAVRKAIIEVLKVDNPQIVRQIFYQLVARSVIEKTENEYKHTVVRLCTEMRWQGRIDWDWITDESRTVHDTQTYDSLVDALEDTARFYRKNVLKQCPVHIEIWVEKAGLASVIWDTASDFDVPVVASKGVPSLSSLYECFSRIKRASYHGKKSYLYQFGDFDPTGCLIPKMIEDRLNKLCDSGSIARPIVERIALTKEQIRKYRLPTRPTKSEGNTHAKNFKGDSVELDALPVRHLTRLVRGYILRHINPNQVATLRASQESEGELLIAFGRKAAEDAALNPLADLEWDQ